MGPLKTRETNSLVAGLVAERKAKIVDGFRAFQGPATDREAVTGLNAYSKGLSVDKSPLAAMTFDALRALKKAA